MAGTILGYAIVAAFVLVCGWYVYSHWSDFAFLRRISYPEAVVAGLLVLASYVLNVLQMNLFLSKFGVRLGFIELTGITNGMILANLVVPMRGGTGGLAVYLKKRHGLDFGAFAVIYAGTALLTALINTGLALMALVLLASVYRLFSPVLSLGVAGLFAVCLYLSLFPPPLEWRGGKLIGMLTRLTRSWHLLTRDRRLLAWASVLLLLISLCLTASFYFIYRSIGEPLSVSAVIVTSSLGGIANLVPLTPGSLGIFDTVTIQIPQLFGLDPARAIAGTLVFRILTFSWACILGIPGMIYIVSRRGKAGETEKQSEDMSPPRSHSVSVDPHSASSRE